MEIDFVEYDKIKEDLCIKVIEHIYQKVQDNKYSFTGYKCKDILKEGCIPLETFDNMTRRRISRIIEQQEERLRLQQEYLENERKKQERQMKK